MGVGLHEFLQQLNGLLQLFLTVHRRLPGGFFGGFVESELREFGQRGVARELFGQGEEAGLRFGVATHRGEVAAFDQVGRRGRWALAVFLAECFEVGEAFAWFGP